MFDKMKSKIETAKEKYKESQKKYPQEYVFIGEYSALYEDEHGMHSYIKKDFFLLQDYLMLSNENKVKVLTGPYKGSVYDARQYDTKRLFFNSSNGFTHVAIFKSDQEKLRTCCDFSSIIKDGYVKQSHLDKISRDLEICEIAKEKEKRVQWEAEMQSRKEKELGRIRKKEIEDEKQRYVNAEFGEDE